MNVVVEIPEKIMRQFSDDSETMSRKMLEALALEGYRSEKLTAFQVGEMLGLAMPNEVDGFLKKHGFFIEYTDDEIAEQRRVLDELLSGDKK